MDLQVARWVHRRYRVNPVGTDEGDLDRNHINWVSPLGRASMQSTEGDSVVLEAPDGNEL